MSLPQWKSDSSALMINYKLRGCRPLSGWIGGPVRGIADVDDWTIRSPIAPLPCHRCEYGGYRGTWSSVNESLLTYLWRNSVKDFPRPNQSEGEGGEGTWWRGGLNDEWHGACDGHVSECRDHLLATEMLTASEADKEFDLLLTQDKIREHNNLLLWWAINLSLWS